MPYYAGSTWAQEQWNKNAPLQMSNTKPAAQTAPNVSPSDQTASPAGPQGPNEKRKPELNKLKSQRKINQSNSPKRGGPWTQEKMDRTFNTGRQFKTSNFENGNPATRYLDPATGDWFVSDDVTGDIIQFGSNEMVPTDLPIGPK
jgi:hypothetical protein